MTAEEKVSLITEAADELKADRVVVLDVRGQTQIADFFIICSGTSDTHIRAIADRIIEKMREHGVEKPRREGMDVAQWVLLDYGDVVAHIFAPEEREYYNLESFWSGARVVELVERSRTREEAVV
ncbi:MAG: ribosome silencing factor [Armatimonadetes bacterium]|nr:ribosome silencing factor [Armatimonadota bacterium]